MNRRNFLKLASLAAAGAVALPRLASAEAAESFTVNSRATKALLHVSPNPSYIYGDGRGPLGQVTHIDRESKTVTVHTFTRPPREGEGVRIVLWP